LRRFEEELEELKNKLLEMSGLVESAVYRSVLVLTEGDSEQAQEVLKNERRINQMEIEIDDAATNLLALQQPMAIDLRFVTAAIKINNDLERMGDLAVNIVERALSLMQQPTVKPLIDIPHIAKLTESMVRKSLDAFVRKDAELARSVLTSDDAVDDLRDTIYQELVSTIQHDPSSTPQCVNLMFVARNLERIADHATNIAEMVVFMVKGKTIRHMDKDKK
jgi:phosphate transport system protein